MSGIPQKDSHPLFDVIDGDSIKRRRADSYRVRVVAQARDRYVVTLDGTDDERAPAVVYYGGRLSHVAMLSSHLKMFNAYTDSFTGTDEERDQIESAVRKLMEGSAER